VYSLPLSFEQRRAAFHAAREPLMILAGAGSGKTKTLISRIQHLHHEGVGLDRMLVLTFSTAATKELTHRVAKAFPGKKKDCAITVATFHSFGLQVPLSYKGPVYRKRGLLIEKRALLIAKLPY
jgi:DNA helicase-2/ATP-dependent DNA helicase PcrA